MYTTKMATDTTTILTIWNCSRLMTMRVCTNRQKRENQAIGRTLREQEKVLSDGIKVLKEEHGTLCTAKMHGRKDCQRNMCVTSVAMNMKHLIFHIPAITSAPIIANQHLEGEVEWITRPEGA
jgi:hypothetical protein